MTDVAFLTDVEGRWEKLKSFTTNHPLISWVDDQLVVHQGAHFVFGGDAVDRGPSSLRIMQTLLDLKQRQPSQVTLLAGNRDLNKLRFSRELRGYPPTRTPDEARGDTVSLVRWILTNTMGARDAFEHRQRELEALAHGAIDPREVAESFARDVQRDGLMLRYLRACVLALRMGDTLFVHGGVTPENLFAVPTETFGHEGHPAVTHASDRNVDAWISELNAFYRDGIARFDANHASPVREGPPPWAGLVAYQAPLRGRQDNPFSVVYARAADEHNNPRLPALSVIETLQQEGIDRVVVGHTPSGDFPSVLRFGSFVLVLADNSYGRIELGSRVQLSSRDTHIAGVARTDDAAELTIDAHLVTGDQSLIGQRISASQEVIKAGETPEDYVLFRGHEGYRTSQRRVRAEALSGLALEPAF